jgi:hypothetical protein
MTTMAAAFRAASIKASRPKTKEVDMDSSRVLVRLVSLSIFLFLADCSSAEKTEPSGAAPSPASTANTATQAPPKTPFVPLDACTLLSKSDVEAITKKSSGEPVRETAANLVTCSFPDPTSPKLPNGQPLGKLVSLAVFTGEEGAYYAGPVAQAKDTFETGRKNAASDEKVSGLGQDAYWDKILHTLHAYKDRYEVEVTIDSQFDLKVARAAGEKALAKLP